jgi:hypothetical protein
MSRTDIDAAQRLEYRRYHGTLLKRDGISHTASGHDPALTQNMAASSQIVDRSGQRLRGMALYCGPRGGINDMTIHLKDARFQR